MICELPLVWHCVVFGPTLVHCGAASATGAIVRATPTPAAANNSVRERSLVRIVGLLNGPRKTWLAAAVAAAATDNQHGTVELVIPRIQITWFGRCGVDLSGRVAGLGDDRRGEVAQRPHRRSFVSSPRDITQRTALFRSPGA